MQKIEDHEFIPKQLNLQLGSLNLWVIESIRIGFYFFAVTTSVIAQILNPYFINFNIWLPVYFLVITGLSLHFAIIFLYHKFKNKKQLEIAIFIIDILFISAISYYTYLSYPVFIILYLVNIILCSFVAGASASIMIAGISTVFYTLIFLSRINELSGDQITYVLNVMTFYFTAMLSGYLGDLLISRSLLLTETKSDLMDLQSLSQVIIKNIGIGLVSYESNKGVSFFNDAAKMILGTKLDTDDSYIKNKILFNTDFDLRLVDGEKDSSDLINKNLQSHQQTNRQEVELDFQGIKKNLEFITTFIQSTDLKTRWVLLVQDLTEIKNLQKELVLKDKLAAIGQLAGGIAHEIRNPLASISGSVEMLKESTSNLNPENTKLFSIIIKEIDRLNLLITDFLSFVRPEVKRTDEVSLQLLIEDIITLIKFDKKLSSDVDFLMNISDVKIKCDKSKLTQAFINIITNALQALKGCDSPKFICNVSSEGYFVSIEFTDNGLGMAESTVQRIFEPFFTTKEKGTGLGLAITHRIIEGHGGVIKVISKEKKGTTFFIRLPIK